MSAVIFVNAGTMLNMKRHWKRNVFHISNLHSVVLMSTNVSRSQEKMNHIICVIALSQEPADTTVVAALKFFEVSVNGVWVLILRYV